EVHKADSVTGGQFGNHLGQISRAPVSLLLRSIRGESNRIENHSLLARHERDPDFNSAFFTELTELLEEILELLHILRRQIGATWRRRLQCDRNFAVSRLEISGDP